MSKEVPIAAFTHERDFFSQLRTVHHASVLFYRRSDEIKATCNACIPELCSVRSAGEIRQVARLLNKSATAPPGVGHPKFSMIVAEVDHTIIKFMEVIHKYYENEQKMSSRLPLLLLMSPNVDEDLKQYVKTCDDVYYVMSHPFSPKDVFENMVVMLHRRHVADELYTKLTKSKGQQVTTTGQESITCSVVIQEVSSSIAEEIDDEDLAIDVNLSNAGASLAQYVESSKHLLPKDASKIRELYVKELKRNNVYEALKKYTIDAHERARIDDMILKNLNKGICNSVLHSSETYDTLSLEAGTESKEEEAARDPRAAVDNDPMFQVENCNIVSESSRPTYNVNDSTESNLFGSELLPFVDRVRPEMSRPRTVAGLFQKNSSACWKVMKTKEVLCKEVEHKHDRPWSTPHMQARKTVSKPITDSQGTMTLETFLKIKDQITKQDGGTAKIMEEAVPVVTVWEIPKKNLKTAQHKKDQFKKELEKTKEILAKSSSNNTYLKKMPLIPSRSRVNSVGSVNSSSSQKKNNKLLSLNSLSEDDDPAEKSLSEYSRSNALGAMRDWRGVSESDELQRKISIGSEDSAAVQKSPATRTLSKMLRSTGGINFGSLVVSTKARNKAKRMVKVMAKNASQDPQTSRLMWVNLENRHCSAFDRDNLASGINHLQNDKLENAFRSFSKAIMVCKQVHIAMIYRGIVQYRRGKFFNALDDFTNASKNIESSNILIKNHMEDILIARFNRGITYFRLGDDTPGMQDIKFAFAVNPANIHVRMMLMQVQRRSSNYLEAVEHCISIKNTAEEEVAARMVAENLQSKNGDDSKPSKTSFPSPKGSKHIKRVASGFESMFGSDLNVSSASDAYKPKIVDVDVKIPESCFPGLNERKIEFMSQKTQEDSSNNNSMFLENFKHANGFKRHMFDTHFIRLSEVQEALVQKPPLRSAANKALIMRCLKSFAIFCDLEEDKLLELAGCVEYRAVNNKSVIFSEEAPVEAVVLVLSGQLQLRLEGQVGGMPTAVVSELNEFDMYGHYACIFNATNMHFVQMILRMCQDADSGLRTDFSPQQLNDVSIRSEPTESIQSQDLPRALQPPSFMTCRVTSPTEMILVHQADFDRLVRHQTEIQFFKRLELLKASGLFSGDFPHYDLVRLGRMCVLRRYRQGETILKQGETPDFVFFVMKGVCRAMKRPDPTEYLSQRLLVLRKKVDKFEQNYTFHHSLRKSSLDTAEEGSHQVEVENDHMNLKAEIDRLEIQEAKEIILEKKRREEEKELILLGHDVPDRYVDVSSLHWPQLFGEAAILQPDTGVSAGTVVADTNCHLMCMHKSNLKTFLTNKKIIDNVKDRSVKYPSHEKLVLQLAEKEKWVDYKAEALEDISKERWPGCQAAKPQAFYT